MIILLDISSSRVTAAAATNDNGALNIKAIETLRHRDSVRYGAVVNVEETRNAVLRVLKSLAERPQLAKERIRSLYLAIGGRGLRASVTDVSQTFDAETAISAAVLQSLEQMARERYFGETRLLGLYPRSYSVNGTLAPNPKGMYGNSISASYNALTCPERVHRSLMRALDDLHLRVNEPMLLRPMAQAQALLTADERRLGVMLADIGAETTTVSLWREGILQYLVSLPIGGRNITRDLTALGLTEDDAERIKCSRGNAMPMTPTHQPTATGTVSDDDIQRYIAARANELVANIVNQLTLSGYSVSQMPSGIVLTGQGARLHGLDQLLHDRSQLNVRHATMPAGVTVSDASAARDLARETACMMLAVTRLPQQQPCTTPVQPRPAVTPQPTYVIDQPQQRAIKRDLSDEELEQQDADTYDIDEPQPQRRTPKPPRTTVPLGQLPEENDEPEEEDNTPKTDTKKRPGIFKNLTSRIEKLISTDTTDNK